MLAVMPPPADRPVMWTRPGSLPYCSTALSAICLIERASPRPRALSPASNQLKQELALLVAFVCG